ncbi:M3 family oligoendopeptidase [Campylobacter sp. 19-13652]|uniref:M3 family oligoendopeptidase n=1 Tax=Campylobacter sp. 19-13652 TaxID=2840180 RepID=UPI001C77FB5C|nr:M3 family oligoendopeptidase [Campylobacter sp. 19-13652]BCX79331.1 peptidase [Campylobacter sp. 19-13652]
MSTNSWDFRALFASNEECEREADSLIKECDEFQNTYSGKLDGLSEDKFNAALLAYEALNERIAGVATYAFLVFAQDTKNGAFYAKIDEKTTLAAEGLLFFDLEFNSLSDEKAAIFSAANAKYAYYLKLLREHKPHQLKLEQEQVLLRVSSTGAQAFARLFDETFSKMRFKFQDKNLSEEEILSKLYDPNREVRKEAALSLSATLEQNQHLLVYIYNMIRADLATQCELRDYDSPEAPRHLDNQIKKQSVDSLINSAQTSFDLVSRYYHKKRELLGLEQLYDYDRYAPLKDSGAKVEYEKAKQIVLEAFNEFSPRFADIAKRAFSEGWIDVYPKEGKRGGAFSHGAVSRAHPYVLLNYTDEMRDVFTLAHELGHAIHQNLSYSVGYLNADTPLTTAETASVFCEMLVFDYVRSGLSKEAHRALLARKLEDIFATLYRQINFTTFEREVHAKKGELSADEFNELWLKESKKMFGDSVTLNEYYKIWWSYIPHFIHTPFYCYAYSYAQLLVLALFGLYKSGKCADFVSIYTEFLSSGGSKSPAELVAMFGFDINDDEFWQIGLEQVRTLVKQFEEM